MGVSNIKIIEMYNSGFNDSDWYILRKAVMEISYSDSKGKYQIFDNLPEHLRASEVGDLIYQAVYLGHKKAADKAAKKLTGNSDDAWLILGKA